jgi:Zn-dependent M16 (insulinase) family peptidase
MGRKYLHREIREKNGAYGGGCSFSALDGLFSFYSYRDPNALRSLESFNNSIDWVLKPESITEQDLTEAKLTTFSSLDAPIAASGEGMSFFKYGLTDVMRQS